MVTLEIAGPNSVLSAFSYPNVGNYKYLIMEYNSQDPYNKLTPLAALENGTGGMLGAVVLVSGRMEVVPEEQAAPFRGHQQWQKGKAVPPPASTSES